MQKYKPYKKSFGHSYTLGIFPTLELLGAKPGSVEAVLLAPNSGHSQGVQKIRALCNAHNISCVEDEKAIRRLANNENCFAIGVFKKFTSPLAADKPHVVLVNPDDAGNLGTILRTMLGFGHNNLAIIKPAVDVFDPKVVRASMGAVFKQHIAYFDSISAYKSSFSHRLYPFMLGTDTLLANVTFERPYALVFGNEGSGLSDEYAKMGTAVRIEQGQGIDSLNLAVSVSIALYKAYTSDAKADKK
jgi:TrmH family RNA methyltransferase